jgi:soluble lytic murein transglycosylase-like protein
MTLQSPDFKYPFFAIVTRKRHLRRSFLSVIYLNLVLIVPLCSALPSLTETQNGMPSGPLPIDRLETILLNTSVSPPLQALKQGYQALVKKEELRAIQWIKKGLPDPDYQDHCFWILIQAYRRLGQKRLNQNQLDLAALASARALALSQKLATEFPYSAYLKTAALELAQSELLAAQVYFKKNQASLAQQTFERAFQRLTQENRLLLLQTSDLGSYAGLCETSPNALCSAWIKRFYTLFSKQQSALEALSKSSVARATEKNRSFKNPSRSTTTYRSVDQDAQAVEAAMKLLGGQKYSEAQESFQKLLLDFPKTSYRTRVKYWLSQALAKSGNTSRAKTLFQELQFEAPLTYYGLIASQETQIPVEAAIGVILPQAEPRDPSLLPHELYRLNRAEKLLASGNPELAAVELKEFRPRETLSSPFLIYLSMLFRQARLSSPLFPILAELLQRGGEEGLSSYVLKLIFPTRYLDLIQGHTTPLGIDPILVLSLIKQESAFDPNANSSVGALGLMQLMPQTALETDPSVEISQLLDPDTNIRIGTRYLKSLLDKYHGNIPQALGAYNAGPTAMDRWVRQAKPETDPKEWIEGITYRETREYVGSILRNYYWYTRKLRGTGVYLFDRLIESNKKWSSAESS